MSRIKITAVVLFASLLTGIESIAQVDPNRVTMVIPANANKIQMAILFDASGSMDGLIDQAKAKIWGIVNKLGTLRYQRQAPIIEIAVYDYGRDDIEASDNYVRLLVPLTTDLDLISQKLFSITTNGGSEYCGAVMDKSIKELNWSSSPNDLKMIFIAGNEPFNQGSIDYKQICKLAQAKNIFINTIFCGPYQEGVTQFWYDGAKCGNGDYFNIDINNAIKHYDTPYDAKINVLNDSLNKTYYGYGRLGNEKKMMQTNEDSNAGSVSQESKTERSMAKSSANYSNASWDLLDAVKLEGKDITTMKEEELPVEFKGKTKEEKTALVAAKQASREAYQKEIGALGIQRQAFIDEEIKKDSANGKADDFGTSVAKSILLKAKSLGYDVQ